MAFNRDKTLASAQKHLRKGNVDKAIREYEKILDDDPGDIRSKLKMADLLVKADRFEEALNAYQEVAYGYASDDLYEKSAAVYKQALRIAPEDPVIHTQLGEAYHRLGRLKDAIRVYHRAQKIYKKDGDTQNQRLVLEAMAHVDPDDIGLRIQLAERYEKDQLRNEALELFRTASIQLKEEGRLDEFVQVAERIIYLEPDRLEMRKEVVRIYLGQGNEKHALKHLQYCFKVTPQDIETLELLGSTFHRLGSNQKALLVYGELAALYERIGEMDRAASAYRTILGIDPSHKHARQFLGQDPGRPPQQTRPSHEVEPEPQGDALAGIEFLDDDDGEEIEFLDADDDGDGIEFLDPDADGAAEIEFLDPDEADEEVYVVQDPSADDEFMAFAQDAIADLDPDLNQLEAYPEAALGAENTAAAVEISESSLEMVEVVPAETEESDDDEDDQLHQFLTESEVFLKYGLLDRAEDVITKVLQIKPDHIGGREQMRKLLERMGDKRGAAHQLVELARLTSDNPNRARGYLKQAEDLVGTDVLETMCEGAGVNIDLTGEVEVAPAFISEISEGLEEISALEQVPEGEPGAHTIDIDDGVYELDEAMFLDPDAPDEDESLSGVSAIDDDPVDATIDELAILDAEEIEPPGLEAATDATNDGEHELDDGFGEFDGDFDDMDALEDLDDFDMDLDMVDDVEIGGFDDDLSLDGADVVEIDVDDVNFDEDALAALTTDEEPEGDFDLDFSAEDADQMFDELFGGGMFDDEDEDDDPIHFDVDSDAEDDEELAPQNGAGPNHFGARSLSQKFKGPLTDPSIDVSPSGVNNSNLELGKTYKDMGLYSEAIEEFRHAMDDPEAAPAALYNIALCHIELGENDDAADNLTKLSQDESMPNGWRMMAHEKLEELHP